MKIQLGGTKIERNKRNRGEAKEEIKSVETPQPIRLDRLNYLVSVILDAQICSERLNIFKLPLILRFRAKIPQFFVDHPQRQSFFKEFDAFSGDSRFGKALNLQISLREF